MWDLGQSLRAEALLRQVAGTDLDFAVLAAEAKAVLG
jgi:hypothetical protein